MSFEIKKNFSEIEKKDKVDDQRDLKVRARGNKA